jgi:hypothetical protein
MKTIKYERLLCWYYWREGIMKYAVEMASGSMIQIPSSMMIGSDIPAALRLLLQQF